MAVSGERAYELLKKLCFIRPMGTGDEKKAAELIRDEVASMGLEARFEEFKVDFAKTERCEMYMTAPYEKKLNVGCFMPSGDTPGDGFVEAEVVYTDRLCRENAAEFAGKAVIADESWLGGEEMKKAGIACTFMLLGNAHSEADVTNFNMRGGEEKFMPMFTIGAVEALELVRNNATVRFALKTSPAEITSQNVIVDIPGRSKAEDTIVFGAHYDSVPAGVGASDNGGGSVILMELLRAFNENRPEQSLRFIWFGGEEEGLHGSRKYLEMHADELEKTILMINIDVAGSIFGHNFVRTTCEESVANAIRFLADEVGYPGDIKQGLMGSDSTPFADKGIPSIGFGRGAARCMEFAHSRYDAVEYCCPKALGDTAAFIELYARKVMAAKFFPIPRFIPENIVKRVNEMMDAYKPAPEEPKPEVKPAKKKASAKKTAEKKA